MSKKEQQSHNERILSKHALGTYFVNTCKSEKGNNASYFHCLLNKASLFQGRKNVIQVHTQCIWIKEHGQGETKEL